MKFPFIWLNNLRYFRRCKSEFLFSFGVFIYLLRLLQSAVGGRRITPPSPPTSLLTVNHVYPFSPKYPDLLWVHPVPYPLGIVIFPVGKAAGA